MKNTTYYNDESVQYSKKRYPEHATNFTHFLFKKRLELLLRLLKDINPNISNGSFLEIGCADGVVAFEILKTHPMLASFLGVDVSEGMINVAKTQNTFIHAQFSLRDDEELKKKHFDVVLEVGVLNLTDFGVDLSLSKQILGNDGYYICSLASSTSLSAKWKPENISAYKHLLTYDAYEKEITQYFEIHKAIPYGLFIPHLWKIPLIARVIQPTVEFFIRFFAPDLFHEKIYLLRKNQ